MPRKVVRQTPLTGDHPAVQAYYSLLDDFRYQRIRHEGAVSTAFENLLTVLTKQRGWIVIPLLSMQGERRLVPDATVRDRNGLPRGYWEAKDTDDDLDGEIRKKKAKGYPLSNIIFEDTRTAVLYQSGTEVLRVDLRDPAEAARSGAAALRPHAAVAVHLLPRVRRCEDCGHSRIAYNSCLLGSNW
jgi:hypothetical protein